MRPVIPCLALLVLINFSGCAVAQPVPPYAAPDAELWGMMGRALDDLPMSMASHQAIQQIMTSVQREAQMREAQARAKAKAKESAAGSPTADAP